MRDRCVKKGTRKSISDLIPQSHTHTHTHTHTQPSGMWLTTTRLITKLMSVIQGHTAGQDLKEHSKYTVS